MGIQSSLNNSLTGTAFLLNQSGTFDAARARTQTASDLAKTEKVREGYIGDYSVDQVKEVYKNVRNADKFTDKDWNDITEKYNAHRADLNNNLKKEIHNIKANSQDPGYRAQAYEDEMKTAMRGMMIRQSNSKEWGEGPIGGHDVLMDFIKGSNNEMYIEASRQRLAEETRLKQEQKDRILSMVDALKHKNEFNKEANDFLDYVDSRPKNKFDKEANDFLDFVDGGNK